MRDYCFIISKDKTHVTKYLVTHCTIMDIETELCYHSTGRHGYICETLEDFKKDNDILEYYFFESDKNIEEYFFEYQRKHGKYNVLTNNCEDFANGFLSWDKSKQTKRIILLSVQVGLFINFFKRV